MLAQYWRIRNKDTGAYQYTFKYTNIELRDSSNINITSQATVTGTDNYTAAIDGSNTTHWSSYTYSSVYTDSGTGRQYIKFSFPVPTDVSFVYIKPQFASPSKLLIEYSIDGNIWFVIAKDQTDTTVNARTITIPAAMPNWGVHPYWAVRVISNTGSAYQIAEISIKDSTETKLSPIEWRDLNNARLSNTTLKPNLIDGNNTTYSTPFLSGFENTVGAVDFLNGTMEGSAEVLQTGFWWKGIAQAVNTLEIDGHLATNKIKSFVLSYADGTNINPINGYEFILDWTDVLIVDDWSTNWATNLIITGLTTGNPVRIIPAPTVSFNKTVGTYAPGTSVALTASVTATIYYTLDGSTPTEASSIYTVPLVLNNTTTIKALAKATSDGALSTVLSGLFTIINPNAYRYWRIKLLTNQANSGSIVIKNLELRAVAGGPNVVTAQNVTSITSSPVASIPVSIDLFTPGSGYIATINQTGYIDIDFGSNPQDIVELVYDVSDSGASSNSYLSKVQLTAGATAGATTFTSADRWLNSYYYSTGIWGRAICPIFSGTDSTNPVVGFSLPPGNIVYNTPVSLYWTAPSACTVYYTLDGTIPTVASTVYSSPITITIDKTIKAIVKENSTGKLSNVLTGTFTVSKSFKWWRIYPVSGNQIELNNIQFRNSYSGINIATIENISKIRSLVFNGVTSEPALLGQPIGIDLFTPNTGFYGKYNNGARIDIGFNLPQDIKEIVIDAHSGNTTNWPTSVTLSVSNDGDVWQTFGSNISLTVPHPHYTAYGKYGVTIISPKLSNDADVIMPAIGCDKPSGLLPATTINYNLTETGIIYYTLDGTDPTISSGNSSFLGFSISTAQPYLLVKTLGKDTLGNFSLIRTDEFTYSRAFRYWRFKVTNTVSGNGIVQFKLLQFMDVIGGPNIATIENGTIVTGSSNIYSGSPVSIDLCTEGSGYLSQFLLGESYITFDFGAPKAIQQILIDVSSTVEDYWPGNITIQVGNDPYTFVDATTVTLNKTVNYSAYGSYGRCIFHVKLLGDTDTFAPSVGFSKPSGTYGPNNTGLTLTATETATIYYTLDGSTPTIASSVYSSTISLMANKTVKAIAKDTAGNISPIIENTYVYSTAFKYWRIKGTNAGSGSIYCIKTLGFYSTPDGPNIVTVENGAIVTNSTKTSGTDITLANFLDNNTNYAYFTASSSTPAIVTVEFPTPQTVLDIKIDCRGHNTNYFPSYFTVEYSVDGIVWATVKSHLDKSDYFGCYNGWSSDNLKGVYYTRLYAISDTTLPVISFSRPEGVYSPYEPIAITSNKRSLIYYTIDGTTPPTVENSTHNWTQPIVLSSDITLKAMCKDLAGNIAYAQCNYTFKAAYKYWRLMYGWNFGNSAYPCAVRYLEFRSEMDGPNIVTEENNASVACTNITGISINNFIDPNIVVTNSYTSNATVTVTFPTPKEVKEVLINVVGCTPNYRPTVVYVQCSIDNSSWIIDKSTNLTAANSPLYSVSYIYKLACKYGITKMIPSKPEGVYGIGSSFSFESNSIGAQTFSFYTIDGTDPTVSSSGTILGTSTLAVPSSGSISIFNSCVIKFISYNNTFTPYRFSPIQSFNYVIDVIALPVVFDKQSGEYPENTLISLGCNETADIYYTIDESSPTTASTVYSTPIDIGTGMCIKAIAKDIFSNISVVTENIYTTITSIPYIIFDKPAGEYLVNTTVSLSVTKPSTIYYTLDGSTPTEASTVYSTPIVLDVNKTIKALAKTIDGVVSLVHTKVYTVDTILAHKYWRLRIYTSNSSVGFLGLEFRETVGGPNIVTAGAYSIIGSSTLGSGYSAVTLTNFTSATPLFYLAASSMQHITVAFTVPRKVKEFKIFSNSNKPDNFCMEYSDDANIWVSTTRYRFLDSTDWGGGSYILTKPVVLTSFPPLPDITWSTLPDITYGPSQSVIINLNGNKQFLYTTGYGSLTPPAVTDSGYVGTLVGTVDSTYTITALSSSQYFGVLPVGNGSGNLLTGYFPVDSTAPNITFTPSSNTPSTAYVKGTAVTLSLDEPGTIYYTTTGIAPTTSSTVYTTPIILTAGSTNIRILCVDLYNNQRTSSQWWYTDITAPSVFFTQVAGAYTKYTKLTLTSSEAGIIRYTTDGSTPTIESTVYNTTDGISLIYDMTIKAITWDMSDNASAVISRLYTIERVLPIISFNSLSLPGTYYTNKLNIYININESGSIYYTTDGSTPTINSNLYTTSIILEQTATIKAIGVDISDNISTILSGNFIVKVGPKILLPRVTDILSGNVKPGDFMISDVQNKMYAVDLYDVPEEMTEKYVGPNQPLAGVKIWHDTASNTIKYNNGTEWVEVKAATTTKDFGGF